MNSNDPVMHTYGRLPVRFTHGEGIWLYDDEGRRYMDALTGLAVCALGHAHPDVARAVSEQAGRLVHTSNLYRIEAQEQLAAELTRIAGMDNVFFCNSGAEANEAAIKIARAHGHARGVERAEVVVADGSFHGRTLATLSATGNRKVHAGFEPLVQGFVRVPYGDAGAIEELAGRESVVAVLVEPILGEGGVVLPPDDYLPTLRRLCDANGWLLMLDEVQTGMARTGRWFAHQHFDIRPDVMTVAKALGNGVPIGACLARGEAAGVLVPGMHGSTFGGNPLSCAAGLAVIGTMEREHLVERAAARGEQLLSRLREGLAGVNSVKSIRGKGMMIGVELDGPCGELVQRAMDRGVLLNVTADRVVRLLPPLIMSEAEVDELAGVVIDLVRGWGAGA